MGYPFHQIEPKWQKRWADARLFDAKTSTSDPKYYILDMFPYPSAEGLHVGHVEGYTVSDIVARYKRCRGFNVLHPIGWDAYGLPAEQYAIQTGIHPQVTTDKAITNFTRQLKALGFSYDWSREISTCDPKYYRWTQYIFLKLYERGLAYKREVAVNWCPALMTVLANDEVVDGKSERGGHPVERRPMLQWMLKITAYAERLLADLDKIQWHDRTKESQRNWIGKSEGLEMSFAVAERRDKIEIFTTRPDTLYGVTFMVLAPEHPLALELATPAQRAEVDKYCKQAAARSERERQATTEKTGVFTGAYALNPLNNTKIPIWVADYVLMEYGTGAIMAVPGHDERDAEFAAKFQLPVLHVYDANEKAIHSELINGLAKTAAVTKICDHLEAKGLGKRKVQYRFRDWLFSRQRYWGEPFPIIHYPKSGMQTVPANELPVLLPQLKSYAPTADGLAPLTRAEANWLHVKNPQTGEMGMRETDTMPGSAGSSWYFLRYCDPLNDQAPFSAEAQKYWMPVDLYIGGAEHTVGHLLYARFWQKVLFDAGLVAHEEPFLRLVHQGMILGEDGEKMSKSRGNVISPDKVIAEYGADSLRLYEMFMGPIDRDKPWAQNGITGVHKFLNRIWTLLHPGDGPFKVDDVPISPELTQLLHQTIAKVTSDIEALSFNTAISQMMILMNELVKLDLRPRLVIKPLIQCLAPFAPHFAEEIWEKLGEKGFVSTTKWPSFDASLAKSSQTTMAVQVNGKTRATVEVELDSDQATVENAARAAAERALAGQNIRKIIFVKNRIINFIVG